MTDNERLDRLTGYPRMFWIAPSVGRKPAVLLQGRTYMLRIWDVQAFLAEAEMDLDGFWRVLITHGASPDLFPVTKPEDRRFVPHYECGACEFRARPDTDVIATRYRDGLVSYDEVSKDMETWTLQEEHSFWMSLYPGEL